MPDFNSFTTTILIIIGMSVCNGLPLLSSEQLPEVHLDAIDELEAGVDSRDDPNTVDYTDKHNTLANTNSPIQQQPDNVEPEKKEGTKYPIETIKNGYATKTIIPRFRISDLIGQRSRASRMNTIRLPQIGKGLQHLRHRRRAHKIRHTGRRSRSHGRHEMRSFHHFWHDTLDMLGSGLIGK